MIKNIVFSFLTLITIVSPLTTFAQTDSELQEIINQLTTVDINEIMSTETKALYTYKEQLGRDTFVITTLNDKIQGSPLIKGDDSVIRWLSTNGITSMKTIEGFRPQSTIRRDEAAAFFVRIAKLMGKTNPGNTQGCQFTDLEQGHSDLKTVVIESCQMGLMKGSNGRFMPTSTITNGQALVVIGRMLDGMKREDIGHYASQYHLALKQYGLTLGITADSTNSFDKGITRGDIGRMLIGAHSYNVLAKDIGIKPLELEWKQTMYQFK